MFLPDIDVAAGTVIFGIWQLAIAAGLLLLALFTALLYRGDWSNAAAFAAGPFVRVTLILFAVLAGWTLLERAARHERADERRALDQRILDVNSRALAAGSSLGCFEPQLGPAAEPGCEQALFSSPETVAAASAFAAANFSLLADALARGLDDDYDATLAGLRRRLEYDRFGFVAQVLAAHGCSAAQCEEFALFIDASRISANLKSRTFETLLAKYSSAWQPTAAARPSAATAGPAPVAAGPPQNSPAPSAGSTINFPSAASIPPVSIMTEEPSEPPRQGAAGQASNASNGAPKYISPPPPPPRPAAKTQSAPAGPPIQIAPPAANAATEPNTQ